MKEQVPFERVLDEAPFKGEVEVTHPAFGMLGVTRWTSSSNQRLFGSDMGHSAGLTLTLRTASTRRGLSRDWHHSEEVVAELSMSESQWARLVSSVGQGDGVPVTLQMYQKGPLYKVPLIASPKLSKAQVHNEEMAAQLKESLAEMAKQVGMLGTMIEGGKTGKKELRDIHRELQRLVEQLPDNTAYVQEQFQRATERTVDDARTEIEAHFDNVARRLGYQAMRDGAPVLLTEPGTARDSGAIEAS